MSGLVWGGSASWLWLAACRGPAGLLHLGQHYLAAATRCGCVARTCHGCASLCADWGNVVDVCCRRAACCRGKTNFFERRVGEYQRAGVMQSVNKQGGRKYEHVFSLTEDF